MDRFIGLVGLVVLLGLAFLMSNNKKRLNIRTLVGGLSLQLIIGLILIKWPPGGKFIAVIAEKVTAFLNLSSHGAKFLFGNLADPSHFGTFGFQFAFIVLPTIIFFSAFMAMLYYMGVMQKVVQVFAVFMSKVMKTSGAESLSCSANIFVGQTEAPLIIRPFLNHLTLSELCAVMIGGFATIAGSVMAAYIQMGVPAEQIIIASTMAVPGSLMLSKIIVPETEHPQTAGNVSLPKIDAGTNLLDAIAKGTSDGLHLALNVAAMLLAFISLIAFVDLLLGWLDKVIDGSLLGGALQATGEFAGFVPGSLKTMLGTLFSGLVYLMGVPRVDIFEVGHLLGLKIAANEFIAYAQLGPQIQSGALTPKSAMMATFMLCGFANFASIGIQIGGLSALAPERRSDLAKLGLKAMLGGVIVSCMTATIAGILM